MFPVRVVRVAESDLLRCGIGDSHAEFRKFPCFPRHELEPQALDIDDDETVATVCDIDLEPAQPGNV